MNDWTHNYLQDMRARQDENQAANHFRGCNIAANGTFYNVVQAIFYIIVFHCDALIGHSKGANFLRSLQLNNLYMSELNPMRVCLPDLAKKFSNYMRVHQLYYCQNVIATNDRDLLPIFGAIEKSTISQNPLSTVFPFDPYLLKRSNRFVDPSYKMFKESADYRKWEAKEAAKKDGDLLSSSSDSSDAEDIGEEDVLEGLLEDSEINPLDISMVSIISC